jgi:probable blue pigment (indigoidine) exporter
VDGRLRAVLITTIAPLAWGGYYVVVRNVLPPDVPLFGAAIRALPAGLVLMLLTRTLPKGAWWWKSAVISLLTMVGFLILIYLAGARLPSSIAATVMALNPVVMMLLSLVLLRERLRRIALLGAAAGLIGVGLLVGVSATPIDPVGLAASVAAMLSGAIGYVLTQRWKPPVPPTTFVAWQLMWAGVILTPIALIFEGLPDSITPAEAAGFAYLSLIATMAAYIAWFHGLAHLPAGTVGLIGLLNPLTGTLLGILIAGEVLTPLQIVGCIAILGGVAAGIPRRRRDAAARVAASERS